MPENQEFEKLLAEERKKVAVLEQKMQRYEKDAVYRGYYALNNIVNQQIDILNSFKLKDEIGSNPKEDKQYDRVKGIWEGLKGMIVDLNSLKTDLKISGDESKDNKDVPFIETVAEKRN
jgi:hypothetical protein